MSPGAFPGNGAMRIEEGRVLLIEDGRGTLVHVAEGCVWLTQEGDPRDRVLGAGESFSITRDGRTVISALEASMIGVASPLRKSFAAAVRELFGMRPVRVAVQ